MGATLESLTTDGRSLRKERNRDAVLDAAISIFEEGDVDPSVDAIADRAGVSNRSIYRYFDHRDHLIRASVTHAMYRVVREVRLPDPGVASFDERVVAFVDHRITLYRRLAPIVRAAQRAAATEPIIAEELAAGQGILRQDFLEQFARELDPMVPEQRDRAVTAAALAFQFDSFDFLSAATNNVDEEVRTILVEHLQMCLSRVRAGAVA
ncbi:MAG: TetR/AcrR family transcriptional regulator [Ilumatobacter sp.]